VALNPMTFLSRLAAQVPGSPDVIQMLMLPR